MAKHVKDVLYKAEVMATGGRNGRVKNNDKSFDLKLSKPVELGGEGAEGTNPEELFAAGYSACFLGAIKFVAGLQKIELPEAMSVTAHIGIGLRPDDQGFGLTARIEAVLPGMERDVAEDLVQKAHVVCPYSHAIKDTIDVDVQLGV